MSKGFVFMVALFIIFIYAFFAIFFVKSLQKRQNPTEEEAYLAIRQLLENPGNFTTDPPIVGIALDHSPYVIDKTKLEICLNYSKSNYKSFKSGLLVSPEHDVVVRIYRYNSSTGDFTDPIAPPMGSPLIRGEASTARAYAVYPNGTTVLVTLTVSGG